MPRYPSSSGTRPIPTSDRVLRSAHQYDPSFPTVGVDGNRAAAAPGAVGAGDPTAAVQLPPPQRRQSASVARHVPYDPAVVSLVSKSLPTVRPMLPDPVVGTLVPQQSMSPREQVPVSRPTSSLPCPQSLLSSVLVPQQSSVSQRDRVPPLLPNPGTSSPSRCRDRGNGFSAANSTSITAADVSQSLVPCNPTYCAC